MQQPFFEIKEEEKGENYAKFVITPLEHGYGDTLGNSLRRVLLGSIPGAAITSVKISQVRHQFSTLKGMREDIVDFVLNLKKVRPSYAGEEAVIGKLSVSGPGEVRAKDIKIDARVKIANGDFILANLTKGAKLNAEIEISTGSGYSVADDRATGEVGLIPVDASFSPIIRVNYKIEETRVGRFTNYDKLTLEIWTDGTVDAKEALVTASKILVSYYNQIVSPREVETEEEEKHQDLGPTGKLSVEEIGLPTRVANALLRAGYESVEDLVNANREDLVKVRNLGEKSVKIIVAAMGEKDIQLFKEE